MPLESKLAAQYKALGVPPPTSQGHGTEDDIRASLRAQENRSHGNWKQRGTDIECTDCEHPHGFNRLPYEDGKHWLFDGTDENGHPKFREIIPKPNAYKASKAK